MRLHHAEGRFVQRRIDDLPLARLDPVEQRHERPERGVDGRVLVGHRQGNARGRAIRVTRHVTHASDSLGGHAVTRPILVGAGLPVAADAHHDQAGIVSTELVVTQPQAFKCARAEVFDEHIRLRSQLAHQIPSLRGLDVDRDGLLVSQDRRRVERNLTVVPPHIAHRVALGGLDLDDVGAEVSEQPRAHGAGDRRAKFKHGVASERAARRADACACKRFVHRIVLWRGPSWVRTNS